MINNSGSSSKDSMRLHNITSSTSNNNLTHSNTTIINLNNFTSAITPTTISATTTANAKPINNPRLDSTSSINKNARQLDCNKSIDSIDQDDDEPASGVGGMEPNKNKSIKRNTSLISFKSLDFNLKTIYSSIKHKHGKDSGSNGSKNETTSSSKTSIARAPYLRVETVDNDEVETLLTFSQSPYQHRGSFDRAGSQYLNAQPSDYSRSQTNSPFLSITTPPNIRRSSTSDIIEDKKPIPASTSQQDNRRPSTSDLLRRARERKGGAEPNKMGRSVSQGGLPRGGRGGRRTSMAF